ncbi:hypothetical protein DUNSADRAFT_15642 [Dunaliella salina]|uniref:Encoded protein n=1 Tax=Dunaliella salina TaxID=3046 RepID=A0ABQ7G536_DUNSA|nr:hypothetical protein DUNSADRAFT_15642 [Dunaliella salina]|eukprot:KAF5829706.1 hypothetical protein DUNSADRAFT_15642 [Dunaliella salina]
MEEEKHVPMRLYSLRGPRNTCHSPYAQRVARTMNNKATPARKVRKIRHIAVQMSTWLRVALGKVTPRVVQTRVHIILTSWK